MVTICSSVNRVFFMASSVTLKAPFSQGSAGPKIPRQVILAVRDRHGTDYGLPALPLGSIRILSELVGWLVESATNSNTPFRPL
jgi:hypothetical protein